MSYVSRNLFLMNIDKLAATVGQVAGAGLDGMLEGYNRAKNAQAAGMSAMYDAPAGANPLVKGAKAVSAAGDWAGRNIKKYGTALQNEAWNAVNAVRALPGQAADAWNAGAEKGQAKRDMVQNEASANKAARVTDRTPLGGTYAEALTDGVRNAGRSIGNWFSSIGDAWNRGAEKRNMIANAAKKPAAPAAPSITRHSQKAADKRRPGDVGKGLASNSSYIPSLKGSRFM